MFIIVKLLLYNDKYFWTSIATPKNLGIYDWIYVNCILNRICEMTKKTLGILGNDTGLIPLLPLLEIKTWGTKWKKGFWQNIWMGMAMGKCEDRQRKFYIAQTYYKHFQRGYGRL